MHKFTSIKGVSLIKVFEGFHHFPYRCPAGYYTIGYGHLIKKGEYFKQISQEEGEEILKRDLRITERQVMRNIKVDLKQTEFDALVSFTYNLGGAALQRSVLRQKINSLNYEEIECEFMRWVYVGSIKLPGLVRRRKKEVELFFSI